MLITAIKRCFAASHLRSLILPAAPIVLGTAMALGDGVEHAPTALVIFFGGLILHIAVLNVNSYVELKKSSYTLNPLTGEVNPFHKGLIDSTKLASTIALLCAIPSIYYLMVRGGVWVAIIVLLGVSALIYYNVLKYITKHSIADDILIFLFLGPIAVGITYYVQSFEMNAAVIFSGFALGLMAVGLLSIEKIPAREGYHISKYLFCIMTAALIPVLVYAITRDHIQTLTAVIVNILAVPSITKLLTVPGPKGLQYAIDSAYALIIVYTILFSIGWIL